MSDLPPQPLDYSAVAEEQRREEELEHQRREAIQNYNAATFGEETSGATLLLRVSVCLVAMGVAIFFLPRRAAESCTFVCTILFALWQQSDNWRR